MDLRTLINKMDQLSEAGIDPDFQTPVQSTAPTMSQSAADVDKETEQSTPQEQIKISNLRKQLNDLVTKLIQTSNESIGYIQKSLLESFELFEDDAQRQQLLSQINSIIQQLEPYKNIPDVADDIARAQRNITPTTNTGPQLGFSVTPEKIKRFQELMNIAQGKATTSTKPVAQKPTTAPSTEQPKTDFGASSQTEPKVHDDVPVIPKTEPKPTTTEPETKPGFMTPQPSKIPQDSDLWKQSKAAMDMMKKAMNNEN